MKKNSVIFLSIIAAVLVATLVLRNFGKNNEAGESEVSEASEASLESVSQSSKGEEKPSLETAPAQSKNPKLTNNAPPTAAGEARPVNTHPDEDSILRFFREKGVGQWRVQKAKSSGKIFRILGGEVEGLTRDLASVREFMGELGPELGVPADELTQQIEVDTTGQFTLYDSIQQVDGIPVFEGWVRAIGNSETHAGFMFNNNLWPVHREEVQLPAPVTMQQAEQYIRTQYAERLKKIRDQKGPVIWSQSSPHQSAYVFDISVEDDDLKVVYGAQTHSIVMERSTRLY